MSFSVNVRLGEVSATTSLSELSASVTISGGLLRSIPFSANKDTELGFSDTITFSVDNPDSSNNYFWEVENENGFKTAIGQSVKQDYAAEGSYDVNLIASNTNSIEGVNFKQDFVKVDFDTPLQLLDDVPGAAAAYSIRLLRQDYSDGLIRVRAVDSNGTDQGEADVQDLPVADGRYIDLNSPIENLDSVASDPNGRGLSNSDTLGDLVDSGGNNYDGFVPKWYDQSPNARHANNSTASEQPQIVDSGTLKTAEQKPAIDFLARTFLKNDLGKQYSQPYTYFIIFKQRILGAEAEFIDGAPTRSLLDVGSSGFYRIFDGDVFTSSFSETKEQNFIYTLHNGAQSEIQLNSQTKEVGDGGSSDLGQFLDIGQSRNNYFKGYMQDLLIYPNDQSSNVKKVKDNANNFYKLPKV